MSQKAQTWAWAKKGLAPLTKYTLLTMALLADNRGITTARRDIIADASGIGQSTIWRHLKELEERKLIFLRAAPSKDGPEIRRFYRLAIGNAVTDDEETPE